MFDEIPSHVPPVYRPPSEARSLILQVTYGCSSDTCTFCRVYRGKKFKKRNEAETLDEAFKKFPEGVKAAVERLNERAKELAREEASRIVVPSAAPSGPLGGGMPGFEIFEVVPYPGFFRITAACVLLVVGVVLAAELFVAFLVK